MGVSIFGVPPFLTVFVAGKLIGMGDRFSFAQSRPFDLLKKHETSGNEGIIHGFVYAGFLFSWLL